MSTNPSFLFFARMWVLPWMVSMVAAGPLAKPNIIQVSDVEVAEKPLAAKPASEILRQSAGEKVEAFSAVEGQQWIATNELLGPPFIAAAHRAFADHRPLVLSPDMIWHLLVQMAAEEVLADPDRHRGLFADHEHGSRTLEVRRDEFMPGSPDNDWSGVFEELESQIVTKVPGSPAGNFSHAFSTSTPTEISARRIVLLKAASPYYEYRVNTWCGIPRIELHGTADDWKWIHRQVAGFRTFNMELRVKALLPILEEFVSAAEGKAEPAFWRSFYKYDSESGSSYVSGWINTFFMKEDDKALDVVLQPGFSWQAPPEVEVIHGAKNMPLAIAPRSYPSKGIVDVDFIWEYLGYSTPMRLRAGFMGVSQDPETMALKPVIAWQVLRAELHSGEREAADFLGSVRDLSWDVLRVMERRLYIDPETGFIRSGTGMAGPMDSRFWKKALPLMVRLEALSATSHLGYNNYRGPGEKRALCEAMLSAPSVKVLTVRADIEEQYLRILQERKDWTIEQLPAVSRDLPHPKRIPVVGHQ